MVQQGWKLIERNGVDNTHVISGLYTENLVWLGETGVGAQPWSLPTVFEGCSFSRTTRNPWLPPFYLIANNFAVFNGCSFLEQDSTPQSYIMNIGGQGRAVFNSCGFARADEPTAATIYMGLTDVNGFNLTSFRDCLTNIFDNFPDPNRDVYINTLSGAARWLIGQGTVRVNGASTGSHSVNRLNKFGYAATTSAESAPTFSGSAAGDTMTFTANNKDDFKLGDILLWKVKWPENTSKSDIIPTFKITNISVGGVVTATALFDGFDVTYDPGQLVRIATPFFVNQTESTGDTHSNTTVNNVTNIANWAIGDWIRGLGIQNDTRIVNIVGTTITLSRAATATASGVALYNCRLNAM